MAFAGCGAGVGQDLSVCAVLWETLWWVEVVDQNRLFGKSSYAVFYVVLESAK